MAGDSVIPFERIASVIHVIRGQKVMLDRNLAKLYGVPTKALKQAVRRNSRRFPSDFMFELGGTEFAEWRSQFVTSKADRMGLRYPPKTGEHHESIQALFEAIRQLTSERPPAIGFYVDTDSDTTGPQEKNVVKESRATYHTSRPARARTAAGRKGR